MNLEFEFPIHQAENNSESQVHLDAHKKHFSKKCVELLKRLVAGDRLNFADEVKTIGDLSRRALDLIEAGIPVQRTFKTNSRMKEYYLLEKDIPDVKEKYKELLVDNQSVTQ